MADVFEDEASEAGDYSQRIRLTKAVRNRAGWGQVELSADNLAREMNGLARELNKLFQALNEQSEMASSVPDYDTLLAKLNGAIRFATDASEQVNKMLVKPHDESIYWIEIENRRGGRSSVPRLSLSVAPLRVGPMMDKFIWQAKDSVVLTSATIQTASPGTRGAPSFNYIRERLGALDADTFAVGSPFDYKKSTLVYLVTDIPEPNQPGYQQFVERGLIALFRASQGRGLALFTNYSSLRQTSRVIAPELLKDEIMVYEQGDGSSRRVMVEQFRAADRAVMLGTRSFWEGVDIQGDKLSALAICKLPFDVPTDPVFSARSETFENAFNDFSVPETVLKFRQGFGRLIRSRSDRGVVLILDKRVTSKNYGASFLGALPDPTIQRGPLVGIEKAARDWLAATPPPPART
jgi:DNA polymerase-3 subunit epsilon/ATP-dependent DNA helicase DinG